LNEEAEQSEVEGAAQARLPARQMAYLFDDGFRECLAHGGRSEVGSTATATNVGSGNIHQEQPQDVVEDNSVDR
jgi:hypothetical protein